MAHLVKAFCTVWKPALFCLVWHGVSEHFRAFRVKMGCVAPTSFTIDPSPPSGQNLRLIFVSREIINIVCENLDLVAWTNVEFLFSNETGRVN